MTIYYASLIFFLLSYLPFINQVNLLVNALFGLILLLGIVQENQKRIIAKPIKIGLMLSGLALIFQNFETLWGLAPGVAVLSLMGTLKLFEVNEKRDFYTFMLIAELALVGHVLTVDDLYMVLYVFFLTFVLFGMLFTFHSTQQKWTKERKKVFGLIFAYSIPISVVLFFLFPRLPLGNLFFNTVKKVNYTGFSDQVRAGDIGEVVNSNISYFRAKFFDNKVPTYFELYWKGAILSQTDGFHWKRVRMPTHRPEGVKGPRKFSYEVTFDQFMNSPLFLLGDTLDVKVHSRGHSLHIGEGTYKFFPYSNQKIAYRAKTGRKVSYDLRKDLREHFLQLPKEKVAPLFFSWAKEQKNLLANQGLRKASFAFQKYITKEKFSYSLKPGRMTSRRPLDDFFFTKKVGFCEHFASSFAVYLRILGIPSRLVTGFHGGQYNPLGQYYLVRGQDAHAWVEAWDKERGWVRIDPTGWISPDRIRYGALSYFVNEQERLGVSMDVYLERKSNEFWQGLIFAVDMFYYEANREFVGFDLDKQRKIFNFLGTKKKAWPWKLLLLCFIGLLIFIAPLYLYFAYEKGSRDEVTYFYHLLMKKVKKSGVEVHPWYGPETISGLLKGHFPDKREMINEVFCLYQSIVYGKGTDNEQRLRFYSAVKSLNLPKLDIDAYEKGL